MNKKFNGKLLGIFLLAVAALLIVNVNFASSQESLYCAERTNDGAWCQNVPLDEVDTSYRHDRTSCDATSYCSEGTCVNTATGSCISGPQATCDASQGGFFYNQPKDEVAQCQLGCCFLGDEALLTERSNCDVLGSDYNVQATFRQDITDELSCLALASPEEKGACVFETSEGRDCDFITRSQCQNSGSGEFHEGFLCTAPELGTICSRTQRTTCDIGKNEVYFVDSCGNLANVYDANKVDDIAYWSYVPGVEGVEIDYGDRAGNINSREFGACSYLLGSTCAPGNAEYGNYICKDLGCSPSDLTGGVSRDHGESWCSASIDNFQGASPGDVSYLLSCYNGEVSYELCDPFRNKLCLEDEEAGDAQCVANKWASCFEQTTTDACLDEDYRDCQILNGTAALAYMRTPYGTELGLIDSDTDEYIEAACVPKYTPGFKFWDTEGTILSSVEDVGETVTSLCEFASVSCYVPFTKEAVGPYREDPIPGCVDACRNERNVGSFDFSGRQSCNDECTPVCLWYDDPGFGNRGDKNFNAQIRESWAEGYQNLCSAVGDCGVINNYQDVQGYNDWRDLFKGDKINWNTLPNYEGDE